jgi:hypothetical protein
LAGVDQDVVTLPNIEYTPPDPLGIGVLVPVPDPPTSIVATAGNRRATVAFVPPEDDGGLLITSYTVTAADETTPANGGQTATGQNPPIAVTGLTAGDDYHFAVTATNSAGTSVASSDSNTVEILPAREPDAPIGVSATAGDGEATVSFSPPPDNGGSAVLSYEVTAIDEIVPANGGQTATGATSPISIGGLTNGDGYTFQVTATNAQGESAPSGKSVLTVPQAEDSTNTPPPPYPNAASFPLEKPVNLIQITDEIASAAGQTVQVAVTGDYDHTQPISPTNEAIFWVAPDTISSGVITSVLGAHVSNPAYGMSNADLLFQSALQKVLNNPNATLTEDEIQASVRGLLLRSTIPIGQQPPI